MTAKRVRSDRGVACAFVLALAWGCDDADGGPAAPPSSRPTAISVTPDSVAFGVFGRSVQLTAEVRDQRGAAMTGVALAWSSSDVDVATVDSAGLATAAGPGTAVVAARAGEAEGTARVTVIQRDRAALVALYEGTNGPGWVDSDGWLTDEPLDRWHGVDTDAAGRVTRLDLGGTWDHDTQLWTSQGLEGPIPPEIAGLDRLESLNLSGNGVSGPIPAELARLENLVDLELGASRLSGPVPPELGRLVRLKTAWLAYNELSGSVPPELGGMESLEELSLAGNRLEGAIPAELAGAGLLEELDLSGNELSGPVPGALGGLSRLRVLILSDNRLSGSLPREMLELKRLNYFVLGRNDGLCAPGTAPFAAWMEGASADDGRAFCNARDAVLLADFHHAAGGPRWRAADRWLATPALGTWHGVDADSLGLVVALDLAGNGLVGRLSPSVGGLTRLTRLAVGDNALEGRLPLGLVGLSLEALHYEGTRLCAPPEPAFATWLDDVDSHRGTGLACAPLEDREVLAALYSTMGGADWTASDGWLTDAPLEDWHGVESNAAGDVVGLDLSANNLTGAIPPELGGLSSLRSLDLGWNGLAGPISDALANLVALESLDLSHNGFVGPIPLWLADLVRLDSLRLEWNELAGPIPPELGRLANLRALVLHGNALSGPIPAELGELVDLRRLSLYGNDLSGPIPPALGRLARLEELWLPDNDLSGPIPPELGRLTRLERLFLDLNDFSGPVPEEFGRLSSLRALSLTGNAAMAGPLPDSLTRLDRLEELLAVGTDLCVPADSAFLSWLETVHKRRVDPCAGADPPAAYLAQTVQSRVFPVPLVAGERALLRVFPTAARATNAGLPRVRARFFVADREVHGVEIAGTSVPIPTAVDESDLAASLSAEIPGSAVQPGLEFVVDVDPDGALDASLGVAARIPAAGRIAVEVRAMPPLDLTLIPFVWTATHDSTVADAVAAVVADPEGHELLEPTRTLLPVGELDVKGHEPVVVSSNDAFDVLLRTRAIRALEGGRGRYMGWMAEPVHGASGVAHPSLMESMSIPEASVVAHELGHNMNLGHAPCGVFGDPSYPHADGSIGVWGYDFGEGALVAPSKPDVMSYCLDSYWISDYHLANALRYRAFAEPRSVAASPAPSILLWGGVTADGAPFLEPSFVFDAPALLPDSAGPYRVVLHGPDGEALRSLRFAMADVFDRDGARGFAFVLPLEAEWRGRVARVAFSGPEGAATMGAEDARPMAILLDASDGTVRGFLTGADAESAAAALQADREPGGPSGRTPVEALSSRGVPAGWAWRP